MSLGDAFYTNPRFRPARPGRWFILDRPTVLKRRHRRQGPCPNRGAPPAVLQPGIQERATNRVPHRLIDRPCSYRFWVWVPFQPVAAALSIHGNELAGSVRRSGPNSNWYTTANQWAHSTRQYAQADNRRSSPVPAGVETCREDAGPVPDYVFKAFNPHGWWVRQSANIERLLDAEGIHVLVPSVAKRSWGGSGCECIRTTVWARSTFSAFDSGPKRSGVASALMDAHCQDA